MVRCPRLQIFDKLLHFTRARAANPNPLHTGLFPCAGIGAGFGISHVNRVVLRDEDTARPAELFPLCQELSILIENLDPVVFPIPH